MQTRQRWYQTSWFLYLNLTGIFLFVAAHAVDAIFLKDNDFDWHRNMGMRFLEGNPYQGGGEWYLLGRAMFNSLPALMPYRLSRAVFFFASLLSLGLTLVMMRRMTDPERRLDGRTTFAVWVFTLSMMFPYTSCDLQDCGLQILLLTMIVAGGYSLWSGQSLWAGFWFALAATFKTTPILFLPVLVWKRRWLAALSMLAALIALNLLPAAYLGPEMTLQSHLKAWQRAQAVSKVENIAENGVEPPNTKNRCLMSVFARYLQTYPPGHPLYHDHPAFLQFGHLDQATARHVAKGCLLLLAAWLAWRMWGRWHDRSADLPGQLATTCIYCGLLSPMCWRHHLVLVLPAIYVLIRDLIDRPQVSRLTWLGVTFLVFSILLPQREVMGRELTAVWMSYKLDSFALVALSLILVRLASLRAGTGAVEKESGRTLDFSPSTSSLSEAA